MPTVTFCLDDETYTRLKLCLARSGETLPDFIREAIVQRLDGKPRIETRLASLEHVIIKKRAAGQTDHATTYKGRIGTKLRAKYPL